ncbi:MAG: hypothetical protein FJX11_02995 [Alphaproteobacteria bacterium]|nr:hypothetical protein [Alphaproteobacteria bacterium]
MNASRVSAIIGCAVAVFVAVAATAQVANFDDRPTGFLTARTGGMPADGWSGTSLATAKQLVSGLPAAPRSRALRDLQFKVLVSDLTPPRADGSPPPSLFARKVEKLAAMGEGESLNEMVRGAGGYADPSVATTTVNALMLAGERDSACAIVRNWQLTAPFARRADVVCRLLAGDGAGALAAAASLRASDPAFVKLVEIAAGGLPPSGVAPSQIDGPAMVMLGLANVQPPAAVLRSTQPAIMRALVALRSLPIAMRLEIAERAEALAIIGATRLGDLYLEAVRDGAALPAPMARRARLVAAARNAANPDEIVRSIAAAYGEARGSPLFPTIARASAAALLNLPAKPQYADLAQEAIRGFLLLGDRQQTQAWLRLATNAVYNNARALIALDRLLPLVAVAGIDDPKRLPAAEVNRWYEVMKDDDAARAALRGYLMVELFRATGIDVPPRSTDLPEAPPGNVRLVMPAAATLQAMTAAAAGRRRAETALLASIAAAETPLNELHPAGIAAIVRALRQVGEDYTARLFAIETAIAYGL